MRKRKCFGTEVTHDQFAPHANEARAIELFWSNMEGSSDGCRSVQDFVRNILSAVNNLQSSSTGESSERPNRADEFDSVNEEINSRFQIPRLPTSTQGQGTRGNGRRIHTTNYLSYNPKQNYSQTKLPARRQPKTAKYSSSKRAAKRA